MVQEERGDENLFNRTFILNHHLGTVNFTSIPAQHIPTAPAASLASISSFEPTRSITNSSNYNHSSRLQLRPSRSSDRPLSSTSSLVSLPSLPLIAAGSLALKCSTPTSLSCYYSCPRLLLRPHPKVIVRPPIRLVLRPASPARHVFTGKKNDLGV